MATKHALETKLDEIITRNTPRLPEGGKHTLAAWLPKIAIAAGVLSLLSAWVMFNWAYAGNSFTGACNAYTVSGCGNWQASRFSAWLWLSMFLVAIQGLMYLAAYPALHLRRRIGWSLMYRAVLLNMVYACVSLVSSLEAAGRFVGGIAASIIALYFLFQVRTFYTPKNPVPVTVDNSRNNDWPTP